MKKISLILAIIMMASLFCIAMPTTAAAAGYECTINGVEYESLNDAVVLGALDEATEDVYIKLLKDIDIGLNPCLHQQIQQR